jgi:hypothetical protein
MQLIHIALTAVAAFVSISNAQNPAVGNAIVMNNCTDSIYLWSVDSSVGPRQVIASNATYTEPFRRDLSSGGVTLKITREPQGLYDGSPQTDFAYSLDNNTKVWYDMSDVFGDPFKGNAVVVQPSEPSCNTINWTNGTPPAGSNVEVCTSTVNLTLTVC